MEENMEVKNPMEGSANAVQEKYPNMSLEDIYHEGKAMEEYMSMLVTEKNKLPDTDLRVKYMDNTIAGLNKDIMNVYSVVTYLENKQYDSMTPGEILQKAQEFRKESRAMQAEGISDNYNDDAVHEWEMGKQQLADRLVDIASQKAQKQEYEQKREQVKWDGQVRGVAARIDEEVVEVEDKKENEEEAI